MSTLLLVVLGLVLCAAGLAGPLLPIPPEAISPKAVGFTSSALSILGSFALSWVASEKASSKKQAQQHSQDISALRKEVCGPANTIAVAISTLVETSDEITKGEKQPSDYPTAIRHAQTAVLSCVGAITNAFGTKFTDQSSEIAQTVQQSLMGTRIRPTPDQEPGEQTDPAPPAQTAALEGEPHPAPEEKPADADEPEQAVAALVSARGLLNKVEGPQATSRVSVPCPKCGKTISGVRVRTGSTESKAFCVRCGASVAVHFPTRSVEFLGMLTPHAPAEIVNQIGERAVLRCPRCGEALSTKLLLRGRLYAVCDRDQVLLSVSREEFKSWKATDRGGSEPRPEDPSD